MFNFFVKIYVVMLNMYNTNKNHNTPEGIMELLDCWYNNDIVISESVGESIKFPIARLITKKHKDNE